MLPVLFLVLVVTGLIANVPVLIIAMFVPDWTDRWPHLVAWLVVAAVALDVAGRIANRSGAPGRRLPGSWLRPLAVHTQVPQWWGHRYGPWLGSIRYGFRLGLGPATILTTWLWWAGVIGVLPVSFLTTSIGVLTFVVVRAATVLGPSWGVTDGIGMASRSLVIDRVEPAVFWSSEILIGAFALAALIL
jgi:hypothetical protein